MTGVVGDDAAEARQRTLADPKTPWLLLLDTAGRPLGWVHERAIPRTGVLTADLADPTRGRPDAAGCPSAMRYP